MPEELSPNVVLVSQEWQKGTCPGQTFPGRCDEKAGAYMLDNGH